MTVITGPKISSRATRIELSAPATTAGVRNQPGPDASPPQSTSAPSERAMSRYSRLVARCASEIIGPTSVAVSAGSPTTTRPVRSTSRSTTSSYTDRWTRTRLRAQQSWPALANTEYGIASIAESRSASANTIAADLPPSSNEIRVMFGDSVRRRCDPVDESPVKEILSTRPSATSASPTVAPGPGSTVTQGAGTPASTRRVPSMSAVIGVSDAGLRMTALPQASAGASFHVAISIGKFHGTISPHTPTGTRSTSPSPSSGVGTTAPRCLSAAPA